MFTSDLKQNVGILKTVLEEVPEICYAGNPVLREVAAPVTIEEGNAIAARLEIILLKYRKITALGRGLAAPQIGENKAVFITYMDDKVEVCMNPKVVERSSVTNFYRELCISAGIVAADVERPTWVVLAWTDREGKPRNEKFEGFKARLYQHEEAHLRGRLNLDDDAPGGIQFVTFDPREEQLRDR
ncbi:MAG: hypothetical protein A2542_01825 [Parcubacteria group bacterium RIFOXYD2_FULL_52_8]|nr:MAG: hypothetical protein A2542_01825 [Parcubacteria group bacterium RIFOXYD2_FULL_52_8]